MSGHFGKTARRRWPFFLVASFLAGAWALSPPAALAGVVRVEEDWELVVAAPDPDSDAPQITCTISPTGQIASIHAAFDLNQRSLPDFQAGGLQLQVWDGETPVCAKTAPSGALMATPGEVVRWTQTMQLSESGLVFEITNGDSTTWGSFGGQGYLKAILPTQLSSLDGYNPSVSVENSGVGYAGNRVQLLVLKRVRYYTSDGQQWEDTIERIVHQAE